MSPINANLLRRVIIAGLLAAVAAWAFTRRSAERLPARPLSFETEIDTDAPHPDHPSEAVLFRRLSLQDEKGNIPLDGLTRGAAHAKAMRVNPTSRVTDVNGLSRSAWTWLGPGNIGGRIRSIVISPTNANQMWIGSVSGGIWTTTNGGATWQVVDDFMANLAVSTLVMNPASPSTMYAGTGEGFYNIDGIRGAGVFKSIDGGVTWAQLASTATSSWQYVNRLAFSPNGATLLAATRSGIWRSLDGGSSWTQVLATETLDVNFDPTDNFKAIASGRYTRAWYSVDGGVNWIAATGLSGDRVEVAYAPSNPAIVYASADSSSGQLYQSTNGGQTYALVNTGNSYLGAQGWYDNSVWVDPTNPNIVIVGGIDLWRSTNGGTTLTRISQWQSAPNSSAHADHHAIVNDPGFNGTSNKAVYFGNDGGIYRAADVYVVAATSGWQELNNSLGITQFYGAAGNGTSGVIIGGTQDNGTPRYIGGAETWTTMFGGDGGYNAADQTNSNYFYGEYVYLNIHRSSNGGASSDYISGQYWNGSAWAWKSAPYRIDDAQLSQANFIAPFIIDPNNANRLLGGGWSLWRTEDARTANTSATGPTWTAIKAPSGNSPVSAIAVAKGNSDLIWVGHNNGDVYSTTNGTLATPTWTRVDLGTPNLPNRQVTRLTIDPTNPQKIYVTFGGFSTDNVWRTTTGGATWTDITGSGLTGLPNVPVRSLVINPNNANWLYVGTEVGIFASEDGGATWNVPQDGPANVSVDELFWLDAKTLIAATHGRGLYKTVFDIALNANDTRSEVIGNSNGMIDPGETLGVQVALTNGGALTAAGVTGTLRLVSGNASPITTASTYPDIAGGATQTNTALYTYAVDAAQICGNSLTFVFTATYNVTSTWTYTFNVPIGAATLGVTTTYTSNDVPKSIPDNNPTGVTSTLSLGAAGTIGNMNVRLTSITHAYDGDLSISLASPGGTSIRLVNQRGGSGDNFVNTILDDAAATPIANGSAPFTGHFKPEEALSTFNDQPLAGIWLLNVTDLAAQDTGTLNGWALDIQPLTYVCTPYTGNPTVQLSAANYNVSEGAGSATITATLNATSASTITVNYATNNGTATAPADYASASGTLTFTPGVTQTTFDVAIVNDALIENAETFSVTLGNPVNATLGAPPAATVTIGDNDLPTVQLISASYSVNENAGPLPITVTLDQAAPFIVTLAYATSDGTAVAPDDYTAASGTLTFTPGVTQTIFSVIIVNDTHVENNEIFSVTLSNPISATLGASSSAQVSIIDNDQPQIQFSAATYAVDENLGSALITVTLNQTSPVAVIVHYATSDDTAIAGLDYTPVSGTLTITSGLTTATFSVPILDDPRFEAPKALNLTLSAPANATLGAQAQAMLSISDNDFGLFLPVVIKA